MQTTSKRPVFKPVNQNQQMLLPPSLEDFISVNHPVRIVNEVINKISLKKLYDTYQGGGTSSYDPRMMLKVLVYSYMCNIYSSRKIEAALHENVYFMWLSGMNKPDHNSINRFRSDRLKGILKELFSEIVILLNAEGLLSIKDLYTDGTKLEANANKYTFVWGKSIKTRKQKILDQINELWRYAEEVTTKELSDTRPTTYRELNPEKVRETIDKINKHLQDCQIDKKVRQKLNRVKKNGQSN